MSRRTSQVAASRGPGLGHEETEAAACAMESPGASGAGGDEEDVGGRADDLAESAEPGGGSGGGGAAGESHLVPNTGRNDGMIMLLDGWMDEWMLMARMADDGSKSGGRWEEEAACGQAPGESLRELGLCTLRWCHVARALQAQVLDT